MYHRESFCVKVKETVKKRDAIIKKTEKVTRKGKKRK